MPEERLHRRKISKALQERRGWEATSSVDGYVFVRPAGGGDLPDGFGAEVRAAVEALGYSPTVNQQRRGGQLWIRISTSEALAQAPRGEHRR